MTRWFRHYTGMMRDPKLVGIAARTGQSIERVAFVWGCILEDASEAQDKGAYTLDIDEIAYFLRCAPDEIASIHIELSKVGLVTEGIVIKWCERQYVTEVNDPGNAERQRRFKAKRKANRGLGPVSGNGEVTEEKRPETETETETDISLAKARDKPTPRTELLSVLDEAHADALIAHRRGLNAKLSPHAASLLAKRLGECSDPNAAADLMIERGWKGIKPDWFEREQTAKLIPFNRKGAQNGVREATDILRDTAAQLRAEGAPSFGDGAYSHDARFLPRPG